MDSESQSENRKKVKVKRTNDEGSAKARMRDKKRHRESEEVLDDPQIKKPRIERELAGDATTNGTSEMQENDNKRGKKRRRHQASLEELPEEERRRREEQRAAQAKAIEMRAAGKVYKRPKKRQATESAKQDMADPDAKMKNQAKYEDEEGSRPEIDVQVIVVPIFWNRKPAEKASVIRAANKIVAILQGQGLTSGMDTTNSLSPGQKFEFWENKGVKVRIEVGPRDASQESCVLAKSQKAGSVAQKSTYKVNPQLVSHVQKALGIESEPGTEVEMTETEEDKSSEAKILDNGKRKSLASGDDLQGDFNEIQLIDDQPKKKRPKSG